MENRIQYRGNGEVTEFFYNFVIFARRVIWKFIWMTRFRFPVMKLSVPVTRKAGRSFLKSAGVRGIGNFVPKTGNQPPQRFSGRRGFAFKNT